MKEYRIVVKNYPADLVQRVSQVHAFALQVAASLQVTPLESFGADAKRETGNMKGNLRKSA